MRKLLVGLIGAGIQRSRSPALQEEEARQHGLRLHYQLIDFDDLGMLPAMVRSLRAIGFAGFNVTYPYKQAVIALLDSLSKEAEEIGAVNTVVREGKRLIGHNTDAPGWSWGFKRALPKADLSRVVLLGAGGAGAAVGYAALGLGAAELAIVDVDASRAAALASSLQSSFAARRVRMENLEAAMRSATGLIHATPVGMTGHPGMPLPEKLLRPAMWVSEVVYVPLETELLKAARRIGCATADGGHMNVGQAILGFKLFTGVDADAARMEAHFRSLVA